MWRNLRLNKAGRGGHRRDESGVVLLLVMLVLALISVLVLTWAQDWNIEIKLAANFREARQCRRLAEAGIYYTLGKMLESKLKESSMVSLDPRAAAGLRGDWAGDQTVREIQFPGGLAAVRVEDEGGKLNLNRTTPEILTVLFNVLGFPPDRIPIMVDSIQDWRSVGEQARPFGAKSAYYLSLDPPYVCRDGHFETVEELSWVRGFEVPTLAPQLGAYLTVQNTGQGVNINTAPLAVLVAAGLTPEAAKAVVVTRQEQPFTNMLEISQLTSNMVPAKSQPLTIASSPFFTIKSTGMVNKKGGRQTIKAIVRMNTSLRSSWEILSWVDDFPG